MNSTMRFSALALAGFLTVGASAGSSAQQATNMTFFVTSAGSGKGADLGGLAGADRICQQLAQAAGAGSHTWHAYLSTQAADGQAAVNARDRIGKGPWQNIKAVVVAKDVAELHSDNNNISKQTALTEKGDVVNGRGDTPNRHDALTGTQPDGTAFPAGEDKTCHNWTSSTQGAAMLGHIDRLGLREDAASHSWNSSHLSRGPEGGCSQTNLRSTAEIRQPARLIRQRSRMAAMHQIGSPEQNITLLRHEPFIRQPTILAHLIQRTSTSSVVVLYRIEPLCAVLEQVVRQPMAPVVIGQLATAFDHVLQRNPCRCKQQWILDRDYRCILMHLMLVAPLE